MRNNPPHILLTNYMMLEYLLVRPADRDDIFANHRCRFVVLDEVHTYRGRWPNIALLVRRLKAHLRQARQDWNIHVPEGETAKRFPALIPVGTSATIKSVAEATTREEAIRQRNEAVQNFFGRLTGSAPGDVMVLGEEIETIQKPAYGPTSVSPDHEGFRGERQCPAAGHLGIGRWRKGWRDSRRSWFAGAGYWGPQPMARAGSLVCQCDRRKVTFQHGGTGQYQHGGSAEGGRIGTRIWSGASGWDPRSSSPPRASLHPRRVALPSVRQPGLWQAVPARRGTVPLRLCDGSSVSLPELRCGLFALHGRSRARGTASRGR